MPESVLSVPSLPPAPRNLKLTLQYDGTEFHGWQVQPGCRTVEGVLEEALRGLEGADVDAHGASRTDQGVHALAQVASFLSVSRIPLGRYAAALNSRLPPDVRAVRVDEAPPGFHARYSAVGKHYRYLVDRGPVPCVFHSRYALHRPGPLDVAAMRAAAAHFMGEHDFASFRCESKNPSEKTVRTIHAVTIAEERDLLSFDVWGRSFLYKMVRTLVGTLLEVGARKWTPGRAEECLRRRDRRSAGPTVPGHGLCLVAVYHDGAALKEALDAGSRLAAAGRPDAASGPFMPPQAL